MKPCMETGYLHKWLRQVEDVEEVEEA